MKRHETYKDSGVEWIGEIPSSWQLKRIKHTAYVKGRIGWKGLRSDEFLIESDSYIVTGTDFVKGEVNWETCYQVPKERYDEDPFIQLMEGDLLITKDGTIGKIAIVKNMPKIATLNSGVFVTRPKTNDYISNYLYWVLESNVFISFYDFNKSGSTIQHLYQNVFNEFKFPCPTIPEQTQIANYLDQKTQQIDDLIANKERLIELLEEERTALINQAVTKGLDLNAPMKDSGIDWLGKIPEHWRLSKIGYETNVIRGASPRPAGDPDLFNGDFLPWITVKEVTNAKGKFITGTESFLTELGSKQTRILEPETLILSNSGATLGVPRITKIRGGINDGSVAFLNLKLDREYLYFFFLTHTQIYRDESAGSGQPNLNTDIVKQTHIPIPPRNEQDEIVRFIENKEVEFERLNDKIYKELEYLKEYKTALISEVVTGKIDVRDKVLTEST